jgi:hypothetical protein
MSGFLQRWSRRKAGSAAKAAVTPPIAPVAEADLPPIDSLTGASDVTAFLAAGVSAALQSRALSVAWRDDPAIAGFRGMADYDWDFNAAGYGRLAAADDVAALLRRIVGQPDPAPEPGPAPASEPAPVAAAEGARVAITAASVRQSDLPAAAPPPDVAVSEAVPAGQPPARPRHGGALPV